MKKKDIKNIKKYNKNIINKNDKNLNLKYIKKNAPYMCFAGIKIPDIFQ